MIQKGSSIYYVIAKIWYHCDNGHLIKLDQVFISPIQQDDDEDIDDRLSNMTSMRSGKMNVNKLRGLHDNDIKDGDDNFNKKK